ncbi:MAG TPA: MFS transporter [Pseudolysinimonas sp.]|nr:MFS transporter [Pseudolysinimonas sp.]
MTTQFHGYQKVTLMCFVAFYTIMAIGVYAILLPSAVVRLGGSYAAVGGAATLETFLVLVGGIFAGRFYAKAGFRITYLIGVLCTVAFLLTYGFATNLAIVYTVEVFVGFFLGIAAFNGVSAFVSTWFIARRDRVLGLALGITGAGTVVGSILAVYLTQFIGESGAVLILVALSIPPLIALPFLKTPAQLSEQPLGAELAEEKEEVETVRSAGVDKATVRRALLSLPFVLMCLGSLLLGTMQFTVIYIALSMLDRGIPPLVAGNLVTVALASTAIASVLLGLIAQKGGTIWYGAVGFGAALLGSVLMITSGTNTGLAIAASALIGAGAGFALTYAATLVTHVFHLGVYTTVMPIIAGGAFVGYGISAILLPGLAEATGSWFTSQVIVLIGIAVSAVATFTALSVSRARNRATISGIRAESPATAEA